MSEYINQINKIKLAIVASNSLHADHKNKLTDAQIRRLLEELELLNARAYSLSKGRK